MKLIIKYLTLGTFGGMLYFFMEIVYRGYSYFASFLMGFVAFILCGLLNEILDWDTSLLLQMFIGSIGIIVIEFFTGCIVNLWLGLNQWDYSNLPFNLWGQICLLFYFIWYALAGVAIVLDDYIRYWFFGEEKPRYKLI